MWTVHATRVTIGKAHLSGARLIGMDRQINNRLSAQALAPSRQLHNASALR